MGVSSEQRRYDPLMFNLGIPQFLNRIELLWLPVSHGYPAMRKRRDDLVRRATAMYTAPRDDTLAAWGNVIPRASTTTDQVTDLLRDITGFTKVIVLRNAGKPSLGTLPELIARLRWLTPRMDSVAGFASDGGADDEVWARVAEEVLRLDTVGRHYPSDPDFVECAARYATTLLHLAEADLMSKGFEGIRAAGPSLRDRPTLTSAASHLGIAQEVTRMYRSANRYSPLVENVERFNVYGGAHRALQPKWCSDEVITLLAGMYDVQLANNELRLLDHGQLRAQSRVVERAYVFLRAQGEQGAAQSVVRKHVSRNSLHVSPWWDRVLADLCARHDVTRVGKRLFHVPYAGTAHICPLNATESD